MIRRKSTLARRFNAWVSSKAGPSSDQETKHVPPNKQKTSHEERMRVLKARESAKARPTDEKEADGKRADDNQAVLSSLDFDGNISGPRKAGDMHPFPRDRAAMRKAVKATNDMVAEDFKILESMHPTVDAHLSGKERQDLDNRRTALHKTMWQTTVYSHIFVGLQFRPHSHLDKYMGHLRDDGLWYRTLFHGPTSKMISLNMTAEDIASYCDKLTSIEQSALLEYACESDLPTLVEALLLCYGQQTDLPRLWERDLPRAITSKKVDVVKVILEHPKTGPQDGPLGPNWRCVDLSLAIVAASDGANQGILRSLLTHPKIGLQRRPEALQQASDWEGNFTDSIMTLARKESARREPAGKEPAKKEPAKKEPVKKEPVKNEQAKRKPVTKKLLNRDPAKNLFLKFRR